MTRNRFRHNVIGLLSAIIIASTPGCHVNNRYAPTPPTEAAKALEELRALPSLEDTRAQLQSVINDITSAATQLNPSITWKAADNADIGNCSPPYDTSDGKSAYLPNAIAASISITENDWDAILTSAKTIAARLGATEVQVFHDDPGKHDVGIYGPGGIFIKMGYSGNLVVSGYTGCRLPAAKK